MKKANYYLILLCIITLISCSTSRKSTFVSNIDPIVGTWKIIKTMQIDSNGDFFYSNLSRCGKQTRHKYFADGTLIFQMGTSDKDNKCIVLPNSFYTGNWEKDKKGNYVMHYKMSYKNGNVRKFSMKTVKYTFSNNNNVMVKSYNYKDEGIILEDSIPVISEISTLVRVKN